MKEIAIVSKDREGAVRVFENMNEAAKDAGVTRQAITLAMKEGRACAGRMWKSTFRIYVVKIDGEYVVCRKAQEGYQKLSGGDVIPTRDVYMLRVVDITGPMWAVNM